MVGRIASVRVKIASGTRVGLLALILTAAAFVSHGWCWDFAIEIAEMELIGTELTYPLEFYTPGVLGETNYCFVDGDYVRYYAMRPPGGSVFILSEICYVVKREPQVGDTWAVWMGGVDGEVGTAVVVSQETITTPLGVFTGCFVVEYRETPSGPATSRGIYHPNTGMVVIEFGTSGSSYRLSATSSTLGGSGALPLAEGNRWEYDYDDDVSVEAVTWGTIKDLYR